MIAEIKNSKEKQAISAAIYSYKQHDGMPFRCVSGIEMKQNANNMIRKAEKRDLSRIAEILVFVKRIKYRPIFHNDDYSFGNLQVIRVAEEYSNPEILDKMWVYDDGIVKGLIHIVDREVAELYVDYFFWNQAIGASLLEFAKSKYHVNSLWALEKNADAIKFYEAHGFRDSGERKLEEGTPEYLIRMEFCEKEEKNNE